MSEKGGQMSGTEGRGRNKTTKKKQSQQRWIIRKKYVKEPYRIGIG